MFDIYFVVLNIAFSYLCCTIIEWYGIDLYLLDVSWWRLWWRSWYGLWPYARLWCSTARHILLWSHCLATGRSNALINSKRCKIHLLFSYSFTYTSIISKSAHIKCSLSTLLDGLKMLSKVWVVLLLLCDSSLFGNRISKGYIFLFKYPFDM